MKLILASSSKMRKEILQKVGLKFTVISSDVDEQTSANTNEEYLINLSKLKANKIASSLSEGVVIGADSMICFNGKRIGKPKTKEEASRILKELSGKVNYALTGVTILDLYTGKSVCFCEKTKVYFDELSNEEIEWYINNEEHILERAGYSLAGNTAVFIPRIDGDYYNVLGMPICRVYKELKKLGYNLSDFE